MSAAADFFGSTSFTNYCKAQEARQKMGSAVLQQIGNVTMAVSNLARALAGRRQH